MNVIYDPATQRVPIKAWTDGVELEDSAREQLLNIAKLDCIFKHVAVMPDVHWGIGATVGSVIATKGAVIPAAVGVDLGCGMVAVRTSLAAEDLPDSLHDLRTAIERTVPVGFNQHTITPASVATASAPFEGGLKALEARAGVDFDPKGKVGKQLGTLGGGNHFIEVCLDTEGAVWVMLHSGSRGVGNGIARYYIDAAKHQAEKWRSRLPDPDLAFLPEGDDLFDDYVTAVMWAQNYAQANRDVMLSRVLGIMRLAISKPFNLTTKAVNCHHNYISREHHFGQNVIVTRKGAVRARKGDLGIIPGSMGARSFIVEGKGNAESFESCSHGAGRRMGRKQAQRTITMERFAETMAGVESRRDEHVLDEAPDAYKDIVAVMAAQSDLVEIKHELKQVLVVKG